MSMFHALFITTVSLYFVFWSDFYSDDMLRGPLTFRSSALSKFALGVSNSCSLFFAFSLPIQSCHHRRSITSTTDLFSIMNIWSYMSTSWVPEDMIYSYTCDFNLKIEAKARNYEVGDALRSFRSASLQTRLLRSLIAKLGYWRLIIYLQLYLGSSDILDDLYTVLGSAEVVWQWTVNLLLHLWWNHVNVPFIFYYSKHWKPDILGTGYSSL